MEFSEADFNRLAAEAARRTQLRGQCEDPWDQQSAPTVIQQIQRPTVPAQMGNSPAHQPRSLVPVVIGIFCLAAAIGVGAYGCVRLFDGNGKAVEKANAPQPLPTVKVSEAPAAPKESPSPVPKSELVQAAPEMIKVSTGNPEVAAAILDGPSFDARVVGFARDGEAVSAYLNEQKDGFTKSEKGWISTCYLKGDCNDSKVLGDFREAK